MRSTLKYRSLFGVARSTVYRAQQRRRGQPPDRETAAAVPQKHQCRAPTAQRQHRHAGRKPFGFCDVRAPPLFAAYLNDVRRRSIITQELDRHDQMP